MDQDTRIKIENTNGTAKGNKRKLRDKLIATDSECMSFWSKVSKDTQSPVSKFDDRSYKTELRIS